MPALIFFLPYESNQALVTERLKCKELQRQLNDVKADTAIPETAAIDSTSHTNGLGKPPTPLLPVRLVMHLHVLVLIIRSLTLILNLTTLTPTLTLTLTPNPNLKPNPTLSFRHCS